MNNRQTRLLVVDDEPANLRLMERLFRREYEGKTLRENLGLPRPDNRFFRGLCEDYGEAVEALRDCKTPSSPAAFERAGALRELIMDLEHEILLELHRWIDGCGGSAWTASVD